MPQKDKEKKKSPEKSEHWNLQSRQMEHALNRSNKHIKLYNMKDDRTTPRTN